MALNRNVCPRDLWNWFWNRNNSMKFYSFLYKIILNLINNKKKMSKESNINKQIILNRNIFKWHDCDQLFIYSWKFSIDKYIKWIHESIQNLIKFKKFGKLKFEKIHTFDKYKLLSRNDLQLYPNWDS